MVRTASIRVRAWSNGSPSSTGAGYGLRVAAADRDAVFDRSWESVVLVVPGVGAVEANLSPAFWRGCREIRSAAIGRWMLSHGLAPWPNGLPPEVILECVGGNRFRVRGPETEASDEPG